MFKVKLWLYSTADEKHYINITFYNKHKQYIYIRHKQLELKMEVKITGIKCRKDQNFKQQEEKDFS